MVTAIVLPVLPYKRAKKQTALTRQHTCIALDKRGYHGLVVGLNNSLLNIMSTTQTYKNDIEDQITS